MADMLSALNRLLEDNETQAAPYEPTMVPEVEPQTQELSQNQVIQTGQPTEPVISERQQEIKKLLDPQAIEQMRAQGQGNKIAPIIWTALQFSPRFGGVASNQLARMDQRSANTESAIKNRMDMANTLQQQEFEAEKLALDKEKAVRERTEFEQKQGKAKSETDLRTAMDDMNSPETEMYRELFVQMFPGDPKRAATIASQMNGTRISERFPNLTQSFNSINSRLEAQARLAETRSGRAQAFEERKDTKEEKKKQSVNEVEERRQNIQDAIGELETMIAGPIGSDGKRSGGQGTFEALGAHNQNMDRLIDQIATDMAKLQDPNSVARPGEVALVKQNLIKSGFSNRNATAMDILNTFKSEVDRRADAAYKIRGIEKPSGEGQIGREGGNAIIDTPKGRKSVPRTEVQKYLDAGAKLVQ